MVIVNVLLIILLTVALILVLVRERALRKNIKTAEQFYDAIWNNAHEFIFLIDKTSHVLHTNYYTVCNLPVNEDRKCFGEILQCRYAREQDNCNKDEKCKTCSIRQKVRGLFKTHGSFHNLEIVMDIQIASRPSGVYNMVTSGHYLLLNKKEYVVLTVHDISEERALKSSLERSNEKFLCFFDNVTVGCAICDKDGKLIEVNDTYVQYMGLSLKEEAVNQLNIYTNPCINAEYKEMMKAGIPISGEVKYDYEKINKCYVKSYHKNVHYFRFIVDYLRDADGMVENILIIWVENTLIHKALRQNNSFREMITYASSVSKIGFCSVNLSKDEQLVTPEYLKNLGVSENIDLRGIFSYLSHAHPDDRELFSQYVEKAHHQKMEPLERNVRVLIDGKYRWIKQYLIQQVFDPENRNIVLSGVSVDIDAQKQTEEALRVAKESAESSDRLKSAFLANMSHEIRTPLNAIVGFSEIIAMTENREEKDEYIRIIRQNSNLLLQLINDILDLSRIESGKSEMHLQPTDMSAMLEEVGKVHNLKMRYGIELKIERPDKEVWTMTDRNRVTQVLFNFLSNAIKNTDGGSITLGMNADDEWLKLYVKDTGHGIPADKLPKIFSHFEKVNEFAQGTGLGLPICKSIIDRLGGRIEVESELGKGSTFSFYLPFYDVNEKGAYQCTSGKAGTKRKKILVAEDIESNYMQINALLNKDYIISWVRNGEEAVNSFLRERPDLILMDIRMPVMNGVDAITKIRSISADIPIIAVTANAFLIEQQQALAAGCNDIVAKPYSYEQLREKVEKYIL